jgi:hypothetical protein
MTRDRARPRLAAKAPRRGWLSAPAALLLGVPLLALPFLLPEHAHLGRAVLTGYAVSLAMKLRLLVVGQADPEMLATLPRLLAWLVTPQASWWPRSHEELVATRRTAAGRLLRSFAQAVLMLVVVAAKVQLAVRFDVRFDPGRYGPPLLTAVEMLQFFLLLAALADGAAALAALAGIRTEAVFLEPIAARSPGDFWARRWNLVVHRFARQQIFLPVARRLGPLTAVALTFGASGIMHEYVVLASVGLSGYQPGLMLAFFALQALAVVLTSGLDRAGRRRPMPHVVAAALHLGWLLATAPLFFLPLRVQIAAFDLASTRLIDATLSIAAPFRP